METLTDKLRTTRESLSREGALLLDAGRRFGGVVQEETEGWTLYVRSRAASAAGGVRSLPSQVESRVLARASSRLDRLEQRIEERLRLLADGSSSADQPPVEGYESLTAKEIVSRLEELPSDSVRALIAFEQAHKGRSTVLKAAQERLAA